MPAGTCNIGKRAIPPSEFVLVAHDKWTIELDSTAVTVIEQGQAKNSKPIPCPSTAIPAPPQTTPVLTVSQTRAALFAIIVKFARGRAGVRPAFIEFIVSVLNADIAPQLVTTPDYNAEPVMAHLRQAFFGLGKTQDGGSLADALSAASIEAPGLNECEFMSLHSAVPVITGITALVAHGTTVLVDLADCVAGLCCEATSAFTEPFEAKYHNDSRPHRGQTRSAANIRAFLDGSNAINGRQSKTFDPECIRSVPQYHGPAREAVAAVEININTEINAAEQNRAENTSTKSAGEFLTQPLASSTVRLAQALAIVTTGARARVQEVLSNASNYNLPANLVHPDDSATDAKGLSDLITRIKDISTVATTVAQRTSANAIIRPLTDVTTKDVVDPTLAIVCSTANLVEYAHQALSLEAFVMLNAMGLRDLEKERKQAKAAAKAAENAAKHAALEAEKEKGMSEEEKEKRRKALEKKAAKAAKKGKGGGAAGGKKVTYTFGTGSTALRKRVVEFKAGTASPFPVANADAIADTLTQTIEALSPWSRDLADVLKNLFVSVSSRRVPKVAKGARDFMPQEMIVREKAFKIITNVFKRHGAVTIETPVFEPKETLTGKYGEDTKLIYDLADQGGEMLALRYDLTVPFARFLATNSVGNIKRYHISRVYRRDQPVMTKGRFREFYQCDYDIAGVYDTMIPDSEVLKVLSEILSELPIGPFQVKINHRKLLDSIFQLCGVPEEKIRPISSAVDKLDKEPWDVVRNEMVVEKGLPGEVADKIEPLVMQKGKPLELLQSVLDSKQFAESPTALAALEEMRILFTYLQHMGVLDNFSFDFSLARGLDYYTGVIYEAVLLNPEVGVGSIAAGGRYDNLVGMFSGKNTPCVGVSIGIERVFAIMQREAEKKTAKLRASETEVLVVALPSGKGQAPSIMQRMTVAQKLWDLNVRAEYLYEANPSIKKQLNYANEQGIPNVVLFGEDELARGIVQWKWMNEGSGKAADGSKDQNQTEVKLDELSGQIKELIARGEEVSEE